MEILSHPIPAVLGLIVILVFLHELGHFLVGRWFGIDVEFFSVGFGPVLWQWENGKTTYLLSAIPLGGYVKFHGMSAREPMRSGWSRFEDASPLGRILTIAAGPVANVIVAFLIYLTLTAIGSEITPAKVGTVQGGSSAELAGLQSLDEIMEINGNAIRHWHDMTDHIARAPERALSVRVLRQGNTVDLTLTPKGQAVKGLYGQDFKIGRAGIGAAALPAIVDTDISGGLFERGDEILSIEHLGQRQIISYWEEFRRALNLNGTVQLEVRSHSGVRRAFSAELEGSAETFFERHHLFPASLTLAKDLETLKKFDRITAVNGVPVFEPFRLSELLTQERKDLTIIRQGETLDVSLSSPKELAFIGELRPFPRQYWQASTVQQIFSSALDETYRGLKQQIYDFSMLLTGYVPVSQLGGPVMIAQVAGQAAQEGWRAYLGVMALISLNLTVLNLIPIPALDGGQILLVGAEIVRRRRLPLRWIEGYQIVGVAMILCLMVVALFNDFSRLIFGFFS